VIGRAQSDRRAQIGTLITAASVAAIWLTSCARSDPLVGKWETPGAVTQALELDPDGSAHYFVNLYGTITPILITYHKASDNSIALDSPLGLKFALQPDGSLKQLDVTKENDSWAQLRLRACPVGMTCPGDQPPTPIVLVRVQRFDFNSGN
jgi:hypothetical protein